MILCTRCWDHFFPVPSRGDHKYFFIRNLQKKTKNSNFLNIYQIKNWEYEPLCKNKWLRRLWQNFLVSTNVATFLIKKIILNIVIRVLKRSVLTRQIQRCMKIERSIGSTKWDFSTKFSQNTLDWAFFDKLNVTIEFYIIKSKNIIWLFDPHSQKQICFFP